MARKIKDIDVAEISLVDSAANRKKFFITKRRVFMDKLLSVLKKLIGEEDVTDAKIEKLKNLSDEAVTNLTESLEQLAEFKDDYPPPTLAAVQAITKLSTIDAPEAKEAKEVDFIDEMSDVTKAGARLNKATITQLKKIKDVIAKILGDLEGVAKGDHKDLPDDVVTKLAELEQIKKADAEKKESEKDTAILDELKKVNTRLETLEKKPTSKAVKKGLDTDEPIEDNEEGDKKGKVKKSDQELWPSLVNPSE